MAQPAPIAVPVESQEGQSPIEIRSYLTSVVSSLQQNYRERFPQVEQLVSSVSSFMSLLSTLEGSEGKTTFMQPALPSASAEIVSAPRLAPGLPSVGPRTSYAPGLASRKYTGLCLSVGGIRGVLQLGGIQEFWRRGQLEGLTHLAGSSVGAMNASLLSIGYEPLSLLGELCDPEFVSVFNSINFMNLPNLYGLYPTVIIRKKMEQLVILKLGYIPTFAQVLDRLGKHLTIAGYCLSDPVGERKIFFSPDTTPDMSIVDAVVLSCAIPMVFQKTTLKGKTYLDGAYNTTLPLRELQRVMPASSAILGFVLTSNPVSLETFLGYLTEVAMIPLQEQDNLSCRAPTTDIVEITEVKSTLAFNFNLTKSERIEMFSYATKQVQNLLRADELTPRVADPSKEKHE
jgi:predicted acylesterase/phospholipase RssA